MQIVNRRFQRIGVVLIASVLVSLSLVMGGAEAGAQSADILADRLASLRADVEGLSEQLAEAKSASRNNLQTRVRQKSELQLELDREKIRQSKLQSILQEKKKRIDESSERSDDLKPVFEVALNGMRSYVAQSLPFRRVERLAELDKLEEQERSGVLTYSKALVRLWSFVEDELRMSRESGSFQQTIKLEGEEKLVQVLRIGMVMLYFQTSDGRTGYSNFSDGKWSFKRASNSTETNHILELFESFKKQIRVGLFRVPNALPATQK